VVVQNTDKSPHSADHLEASQLPTSALTKGTPIKSWAGHGPFQTGDRRRMAGCGNGIDVPGSINPGWFNRGFPPSANWLLKWTHPNQTAQGFTTSLFIRDFFVPSGCKISEQVCLATSSRPKQQNVRFRVVLHLDQHYSHATAQFQQIWKFYFQFNIDGKPNVWTSPPKKRYHVVACTTTIHYLLYSIIYSHEISWTIWNGQLYILAFGSFPIIH